MTHPMPDQSTTETPRRMTTAEAAKMAQDAMALAANVTEDVERLDEKFTELDQRMRDTASTTVDPADVIDAEGKPVVTRDQVDSRIHEALAPLHEEVHELRQKGTLTPESTGSLSGVLARLEDAERKLVPLDAAALTEKVATALHPSVAELRRRLSTLEEAARAQEADPASHTLAEDHLSDQLEGLVDRKVAAMFEATGLTPARLANLTREFDQLTRELAEVRVHLGAIDNRVAVTTIDGASAARLVRGAGAAKKVLELMRMVTHIGKERQADMGTGGKFKFRGIDEAMDAVGHAMREVGVILSPEVLKDETATVPVTKKGDGRNGPYESTILWTTTKLTMRYTFVDPEDGSTHPIEMVGEGRDASDKSTSKAGSMAFKYALLQALCIPVNGLDDSDASPPQVMENERSTPPAQQRDASDHRPPPTEEQRAHRAGEALAAIRSLHHVPRAEQYNRLVSIMNRVKQEDLLEFVVDGSTLNQHGLAATATLRQQSDQDKQAGEYQPSPGELDRAVRDLSPGQYPPDDDQGGY